MIFLMFHGMLQIFSKYKILYIEKKNVVTIFNYGFIEIFIQKLIKIFCISSSTSCNNKLVFFKDRKECYNNFKKLNIVRNKHL